jgi:hypothetical protein
MVVTSFNEELRANAGIHTGRRTAALKKDAIYFQRIGHPYESGIQAQPFQSGELQRDAVESPCASTAPRKWCHFGSISTTSPSLRGQFCPAGCHAGDPGFAPPTATSSHPEA